MFHRGVHRFHLNITMMREKCQVKYYIIKNRIVCSYLPMYYAVYVRVVFYACDS